MEGIVTVMKSGGQYQVVIGNHVPVVFAEVIKAGTLLSMRLFQQKKFDRLICYIDGILVAVSSLFWCFGCSGNGQRIKCIVLVSQIFY